MYLSMLKNTGKEEVFMRLANIVATACFEDSWSHSLTVSMSHIVLEDWKPSDKEAEVLTQYANELGLEVLDLVVTYDAEKLISLLEVALSEVKSLDRQARRKVIIESLVDKWIQWEELSISSQESKVMMFELLALAYVDSEYDELERHAISAIADKLSIDIDELEEMEELIKSYVSLYSEGLEIINN